MSDNESNNGPLKDIRVIELGQLIAGPFCGQLMADMGADVGAGAGAGAGTAADVRCRCRRKT